MNRIEVCSCGEAVSYRAVLKRIVALATQDNGLGAIEALAHAAELATAALKKHKPRMDDLYPTVLDFADPATMKEWQANYEPCSIETLEP